MRVIPANVAAFFFWCLIWTLKIFDLGKLDLITLFILAMLTFLYLKIMETEL